MKVWTCKDHDGFNPVGACSVVVAETEDQARDLLYAELEKSNLHMVRFTLQLIDMTAAHATILLNGDY